MTSLVMCTFPRKRTWISRNWNIFAIVIILIVSPSISSPNQEIKSGQESSSNPTRPIVALSSRPTLPSSLSPLLGHSDTKDLKPISKNQDHEASRTQKPFLQIPNFLILPDKIRNHWRSSSSQPSISTPATNKQLQSFVQTYQYEDHPGRPTAPQMSREVQVSQLTKRQQLATASTPTEYFPQPFDTSLGTEFESDTCQPFMSKFLNNPSFQECHPFSLLLATSEAFFRTHSTLSSSSNGFQNNATMQVKQVLDAACKADVYKCTALLDQLAVSINSTTIGCGKDLEKQNSLPLQALEGLRNYKLMREVACLTTSESEEIGRQVQSGTNSNNNRTIHGSANNSTLNSTLSSGRYCFERAVSSSKPDDLYYYYLPLGTSLPSGTQSSCDQCIRSMMKLYSIDASNSSLAISKTYLSARTVTDSECGPGFAPLPINMGRRFASAAHRCSGRSSTFPLKLATWVLITVKALLVRI